MAILILSHDYVTPMTKANDKQPMTSYSQLVATMALPRVVFKILTMQVFWPLTSGGH